MSEKIIKGLEDAVANQDIKETERLAKEALEKGVDASEAIAKGLCAGMQRVGEMWKNMEVFYPEVMASADAYYGALNILKPHIKHDDSTGKEKPVIVIGTIWGDLHTVGKDICIPVFEGEGFDVIDLGIDVQAEQYIEAVKEHNPDVLGLGTYMSETFVHTKALVEALRKAGVEGELPLIICGGPAVDDEAAVEMGADGAYRDAWEAVESVKNRLAEIKEVNK